MASEVTTRIGPEMHGMKISLEEFAPAETEEGYIYELEKGIIVVDVPRLPHSVVVRRIKKALERYDESNPGSIVHLAGGIDSVIRLPGMESERHPDITLYQTSPTDPENPWDDWTPDVVFEVVSRSSVERDYQIKRDEYLRAGVRVYCIIDPQARTALVLSRKGDTWWETRLAANATLTLPTLPGFSLSLADLFAPLT
jgi:Uma2 family endonuclease